MGRLTQWINKDCEALMEGKETVFSDDPKTMRFLTSLQTRILRADQGKEYTGDELEKLNFDKRIWRRIRRGQAVPVDGYPNYYVDENGSVYCLKKNAAEVTQTPTVRGYKVLNLSNGKQKTFKAHRLIAQYHVPNPDPERLTDVHHLDDRRGNNTASNLMWTTHQANLALRDVNKDNVYARTPDYICAYCGVVTKNEIL